MKPHSNTTRLQALAGTTSLQRPQMAGYVAGAVGTAAMLCAPQSEAAVTAVTFGFGSVLDQGTGSSDTPVTGGGVSFGTLFAEGYAGNVSLGHYVSAGLGAVYNNNYYTGFFGRMSFFSNGTIIGGGANGGTSYLSRANALSFGYSGLGLGSDQLHKEIGFVTNTGNWGWADVSWNEAAASLTINSAFVESVPNMPITISVSSAPEPSRALLALAGLAGVALRRRRKQVA